MNNLESFSFTAAIACLGLSILFAIWRFVGVKTKMAETNTGKRESVVVTGSELPGYLNLSMLIAGLLAITLSMIARAVISGHGPFSSMYEFAIAFSWGVMVMSLFFWWRYKIPLIGVIGDIVALGLLIFAQHQPSRIAPLMPALQQSLLLTTHVASAVISYGAFAIGFGASLLYLVRNNSDRNSEILDDLSYHTVLIGFPFMTLVIVLGALWADVAWGKYWSWDPKETASLVTWLLYASYLHARVLQGWRGKRAAILLIIGFGAVLITFFGNYIFSGLHSYS